ncbi:MAG: polyprenol monophosphomannose synthase [Pirellulales bacterium]|nr:polyprenol monophosphomannose synthase [Pirellulales bacterium]
MDEKAAILVALATYKEIENLPSLVAAIHETLPQADVLVVDDNSPDGTGSWCEEYAKVNAWFSVHHRPGKLGLGAALAYAMEIAVARDYQVLITMDADWSHPPSSMPAMVEASRRADVVVGSRYCAGGGIEGWPWRRRAASRLINALTRCLLGTPTRDCSSNYRLYRASFLSRLTWDTPPADGYVFIEEVLWRLHRLGARLAEVPILFTDRRAGSSKLNSREALAAFQTLLRLTWQRISSTSSKRVQK